MQARHLSATAGPTLKAWLISYDVANAAIFDHQGAQEACTEAFKGAKLCLLKEACKD